MRIRESSERHANRVARATRKEGGKAPNERHPRPYERVSHRANLINALEEWALDYEGTHSIFED